MCCWFGVCSSLYCLSLCLLSEMSCYCASPSCAFTIVWALGVLASASYLMFDAALMFQQLWDRCYGALAVVLLCVAFSTSIVSSFSSLMFTNELSWSCYVLTLLEFLRYRLFLCFSRCYRNASVLVCLLAFIVFAQTDAPCLHEDLRAFLEIAVTHCKCFVAVSLGFCCCSLRVASLLLGYLPKWPIPSI